jgi:hypothetical protein
MDEYPQQVLGERGMKRTTVLLHEELLLALDELSRQNGLSKAEIFREALTEYLARRLPKAARLPSFAACASSGYKGSLGQDAEKILGRAGKKRGWK